MYARTSQFDTRTRELVEEIFELERRLDELDDSERAKAPAPIPAAAPALCGS